MILPARCEDDSSGVSSASSACVSEPAPRAETPPSPAAEPDPESDAGGFSVFGEKLDLFMEILQTQQRLQQDGQDLQTDITCEEEPALSNGAGQPAPEATWSLQGQLELSNGHRDHQHRDQDRNQQQDHQRDHQRDHQQDHQRDHQQDHQRDYHRDHQQDHHRDHQRDYHRDHQRDHHRDHQQDQHRDHQRDHQQDHHRDHPAGSIGSTVEPAAAELLQELLEWVSRREAELDQLEPLTGDVSTLQQRQEAVQSLLSQLEDRHTLISATLNTASAVSSPEHNGQSEPSDSKGGSGPDGDLAPHLAPDLVLGRQLTGAVGRDAAQLQDRWRGLQCRADQYSSRVQSALAKMHVLEKCMQDVERRLSEFEGAQDDVSDDVTEDRLLEVQRSLDDVTDQATRLAENGVPLSGDQSARLASLAGRLRQLSCSLSGGGGAVPELGRSVEPPWERAETEQRVPYYLHHGERRTQWDHPRLVQLVSGMAQLETVRFSAYRTALKLRRLQRTLLLHRLPLAEAAQTFESEAWRLPAAGAVAVPDVLAVLAALYGRLEPPAAGHLALRLDLCLNWLLNVYDSRRTGHIPVFSFKLAIVTLCKAHLEEKYRYMFQLSADGDHRLDGRRLSRLLRQLLQLPGQLGETAAFGAAAVQPSVASCLAAAAGQPAEDGLCEDELLDWLRAEPQSLVWLPVLHRVAGAETARHQARCNTCKLYPIIGFRYRCLKCFNWDMCQQCFFTGRVSKGHKLSHPMHEYCTESSSSDDIKDFTRLIRNRFKSKHYFRKPPKLAYLPVQPPDMSEGDERSRLPGQNTADHLQTSGAQSSDTDAQIFSSPDSEEELQLITQYCLGLSPGGGAGSESLSEAARDQHLRAVIRHLEQENRALQAEYRRLTAAGADCPADTGRSGSPAADCGQSGAAGTEGSAAGHDSDPDRPPPSDPTALPDTSRTKHSPAATSGVEEAQSAAVAAEDGAEDTAEDAAEDAPPAVPAAEDGADGQHQGRLQTRMQLLDRHNRQLGQQLSRLRMVQNGVTTTAGRTGSGGTNLARSSTLQTRSVTASQLDSGPAPEQQAGPVTNGEFSRPTPLAFSLASREGYAAELTA